jgi:Relaxase/Mobilisation nuclease domain
MISKVFVTAKTFWASCVYVCQDLERSLILDMEGVRDHDLRLMADDFELQQSWANQVKEKPVFHGVLSFPHGEEPENGKLVEIARQYLKEIRVDDTQYVMVKHTDKDHLHLHIVANRVSHSGEIVGEGLVIERGIKAAQKLTQEYHLQPDQGKRLEQTNFRALHEPDAKRYRLYEAIREVLPSCQRMEDLEMRLLEKGISTRYRIDKASGERQGISFRIENQAFKGSIVDKDYSLRGLERTLTLQRELARELALKQAQELERARELERAQALKQAQELERTQALALERTRELEQTQALERKRGIAEEFKPRLRQGPRLSI